MYPRAMIIMILSCCTHAAMASVKDSLAAIYYDVVQYGDRYVVNQGTAKALFDKDGQALTAFDYKEIIPGLDGKFVATAYKTLLLDRDGKFLQQFPQAVAITDTTRRLYRTCQRYSCQAYDSNLNLISSNNGDEASYLKGRMLWYNSNYTKVGVTDTFGNVLLPTTCDKATIGRNGYACIGNDSIWVYDMSDRLLFGCRGSDCRIFDNGLIGTRMYGLWDVRDREGRQLQGYKYWDLKNGYVEDVIEGSALIDKYGREISTEYDRIHRLRGGWYYLNTSYYRSLVEIRDENLNYVMGPIYAKYSVETVGDRYLAIYQDPNKEHARLYDRGKRKFTDLQVEKEYGHGIYKLKDLKTGKSSIRAGNKLPELPAFEYIEQRTGKNVYYEITTEKEKAYRGDLFANIDYLISYSSLPLPKTTVGLLDSEMNLIVPMRYAEIDMFSDRMVYMQDTSGTVNYLQNLETGKEWKFSRAAQISHEWNMVRITDTNYSVLFHRDGQILYEGDRVAIPLSAMYNEAAPTMPDLLLINDHQENSALYSTEGTQLTPHAYRQVEQKVAGLISLKKGDSVYFFNFKGRMMFGGRGFTGRNYHLLKGFSVVYREGERWQVMDADGDNIAGAVYDSLYVIDGTQPVVRRGAGYTLLNDMGVPMYAARDERPVSYQNGLLSTYSNKRYLLKEGRLTPAKDPDIKQAIERNQGHSYNNLYAVYSSNAPGALPAGVYNGSGKKIAPIYAWDNRPEMRDDKVIFMDSLKQKIAIADSTGKILLSYTNKPTALVINGPTYIAVYKNAQDILFQNNKEGGTKTWVSVDSVQKSQLTTNNHYHVRWGMTLLVTDDKGNKGIVSADGKILWDNTIQKVTPAAYNYIVEKTEGTGLMDEKLNYVQPANCKDIRQVNSELLHLRCNGGGGAYYWTSRTFIPPIYDEIYTPNTLQNGYLKVKKGGRYFFINSKNESLIPPCDSIWQINGGLHGATVIKDGAAFVVTVNERGDVQLQQPGARKRTADGTYPNSIVIYSENGKVGLFDNRTEKELLPPVYDVIKEKEGNNEHPRSGDYIAWKYKADKKEGVDSTIAIEADGRVVFRSAGGYQPRKLGYELWALNDRDNLPYADSAGRIVIPDTFESIEQYNDDPFFVAETKDGHRLMNTDGAFTSKIKFNSISHDPRQESPFYYGETYTDTEEERIYHYYLVDIKGEVLSDRYDDMELQKDRGNGETNYFAVSRNNRYGLLNEKGEEIVTCKYDSIGAVYADKVIVKKQKWGMVNMKGKVIAGFEYDELKFVEGIPVFRKENKSGYLDQKGKEVPWY